MLVTIHIRNTKNTDAHMHTHTKSSISIQTYVCVYVHSLVHDLNVFSIPAGVPFIHTGIHPINTSWSSRTLITRITI